MKGLRLQFLRRLKKLVSEKDTWEWMASEQGHKPSCKQNVQKDNTQEHWSAL